MEKTFNNLADLRLEIALLRTRRYEQENAIKEKFNGPGATLTTVFSLFKGDSKKSFLGDLLNQDIVSNISRVLLPTLLNTLVFKKSGLITKAIVTFLSQKAAKNVNTNVVTDIFDKVKTLFSKKDKTAEASEMNKDYGIPPDSETY